MNFIKKPSVSFYSNRDYVSVVQTTIKNSFYFQQSTSFSFDNMHVYFKIQYFYHSLIR